MVDFGTDVSTFPGLDMTGRTITGVRAVAEAVARRFVTPNGTLEYDRDFGRDLRDLLNEDFDDRDIAREQAAAELEAEKDERVKRASVSFVLDRAAMKLTVRIGGVLADGRDTPFEFVLSIDKVSAKVLEAS